ncbi:MAG: PAQR family membrane homeostasis protein TrhA [Roseinatronobacter sp.]
MPTPFAPRNGYSPAEKRLDAVIHIAGVGAAVLAVPFLIWAASLRSIEAESGSFVLGASIYAACLVAMLSASALYNLGVRPSLNWLLQRIDHAAIYLKIAGTYTPFTLITGQGLGVLAGLWGAAAVGVALKLFSPVRFRVAALALYLGMGWASVVILPALAQTLPVATLVLMVLGGLVYTTGVLFYLWTRLPYHFAIWHIFVLVGSFLFYAAVMVLLLAG